MELLKGAVNPGSVWENRDGEWVCVDPGQEPPAPKPRSAPEWLVELLREHRANPEVDDARLAALIEDEFEDRFSDW